MRCWRGRWPRTPPTGSDNAATSPRPSPGGPTWTPTVITHRGRYYGRRADHAGPRRRRQKRRRRSRILLGASIAAVLVTAIGVVGYVMQPTRKTASAPAANTSRHHDPPQYSTARTASTTTMKSKRSTAPHMPYTPPTTPVGGPFTHRADPRDALPPRPSWTPTTRKWRAPRPSQPITVSSTVTGNPRPFSANLPSRAALEQTVKSLQALIPSC